MPTLLSLAVLEQDGGHPHAVRLRLRFVWKRRLHLDSIEAQTRYPGSPSMNQVHDNVGTTMWGQTTRGQCGDGDNVGTMWGDNVGTDGTFPVFFASLEGGRMVNVPSVPTSPHITRPNHLVTERTDKPPLALVNYMET